MAGVRGPRAGGCRQHHEQLALLDRVPDGDLDAAHHAIGLRETSCSIFIASSTTSAAPARTGLRDRVPDRHHHAGERRGHGDLWGRRHREIIAQESKELPSRLSVFRAEQLSAAERREALKEVFERAQGCTRCAELARTRKTVVFGAGNADADLMFVGEAPGASEDEQGLPFVGQAGKLLEKLLGEIGMARADVFIANILKCRPPGNRDPQPAEIENCREYLYSQVELIQPRVICTLGNFSTKLLREDPTGITRAARPAGGADGGPASGAAVPDLPPRGGALHAADAGDAARGLPAAAGAACVGRAAAAGVVGGAGGSRGARSWCGDSGPLEARPRSISLGSSERGPSPLGAARRLSVASQSERCIYGERPHACA